ncbi:MAG: phosphatase PAP2 family protein [Rickettsiales bacterium]|nr:phosphatase PAP2 family protein [Rickettsiales bacterium]
MAFGKMIFYDWAGANELLFKTLNGDYGQVFSTVMVLISKISDFKHFPFYFGLLSFCALLDYGLRKLKGRGGANHCLIAWFGVLSVFGTAAVVDAVTIKFLKNHMEYARPYVALEPSEVTILEFSDERENDYRSFPSSHAAFVALMLASVWPVISNGMRKVGIFGLLMVCWSRIAVGMHFPADLLYAVIISVVITFFVRWFLYRQFLRFNLKC